MTAKAKLSIPAEHPAFAGHFPGMPILPGVVLLDEAIRAIEGRGVARISSAKFLRPVQPGETLTLEYGCSENGSIRFTISSEAGTVATGVLVP